MRTTLPPTRNELLALRAQIDLALSALDAKRNAAVSKARAVAAANGFTLEELLGDAAPVPPPAPIKGLGIVATRKPKRPRKAKSSNGVHAMRDSAGVIWAGRGRMPKGFDKASAVPVQ